VKLVMHRINTIAELRNIPAEFGTEIDIRADGSQLHLHHDPFQRGDLLSDYLDEYRHGLLVLNIKEAGIESEVLKATRARNIKDFFLLDVEMAYIFSATKAGERAIAVRYSEYESIETVGNFSGRVDWVWIDTVTKLPLDPSTIKSLSGFRTCLVCPERWGRPNDIPAYRSKMRELGFEPDAVMTSEKYVAQWRTTT
jgi:hypothetical protein